MQPEYAYPHTVLDIAALEPLSDDQFYALCQANPQLRMERTANHQIIVMAPTGGETSRINFTILGQFFSWLNSKPGYGYGFDSNGGFLLPSNAIYAPDVALVLRPRWEALTPEQRKKFLPLVPDFLIEIRSESDRLPDLQAKMQEWVTAGVTEAWLIDPVEYHHAIYRKGQNTVLVEGRDITLVGEGPVAGFSLALAPLYL